MAIQGRQASSVLALCGERVDGVLRGMFQTLTMGKEWKGSFQHLQFMIPQSPNSRTKSKAWTPGQSPQKVRAQNYQKSQDQRPNKCSYWDAHSITVYYSPKCRNNESNKQQMNIWTKRALFVQQSTIGPKGEQRSNRHCTTDESPMLNKGSQTQKVT